MTKITLEESLSMFMAEIAKRLDENTNLIKELRASTDFAFRNQQASTKALEIQVRQISTILHEKLSGNLQSSTKIKPRVSNEMISTSVETDKPSIRRIDASQYAVSNLQNINLFSESKKTTGPSPSRLNDDHWDELKETDREKDLEVHYTNAKPLGKALPRKEIDTRSFTLPCFIRNMCFNRALADLGARVSVMPYSTYTTLGLGDLIPTKLIVKLADRTVKRPKGIAENVLVGIDKFTFPVDFVILDILEDFKTPLILGRPFLSTAHAIINVFKAKITLSVRNDKIFFKSNKPTSNIIKRVYALCLIQSTELDLEARLMGNTSRKNESHDPKFEDYIELSDLNKPLELRHDQVVDLGPTIEEGEVIDTPIKEIVKTRHVDDKITNGIKDYPSFSDFDRKIHVNDAYNLRFFCMIGYEHIDANFFPLLSINIMSKRFYNSIMKDMLEFKGKSIVGAFVNAPIFVGTFSIMTDFAVIEDMDHYRDEEIGDVIVGKVFCKEIGVKAKRIEGMITIYNGNGEMTYQMARSHLRFKHHTNEQCNKMPPLLKVSEEDKMNGISHSYQKLKRFYKGALNLGPDFIRDPSMEEWLTRGNVSDLAEKEIDEVGEVSII
ncbi:reverse transcriptase domain-containing protein [Tanacetum coccineum]